MSRDWRQIEGEPLFSVTARFAKVFSDFTRCLADESEPIVFIFDDMHWADEKSVALIDKFLATIITSAFDEASSYRPSVVTPINFSNFE